MALLYFADGRSMWSCGVCGKHIDYDLEGSFNYCKEHAEEGRKLLQGKRASAYRNELASYSVIETDNLIVCPYCFHEDNEWWEHSLDENCTHEISCPSCEKDFEVEIQVTYSFTTRKGD